MSSYLPPCRCNMGEVVVTSGFILDRRKGAPFATRHSACLGRAHHRLWRGASHDNTSADSNAPANCDSSNGGVANRDGHRWNPNSHSPADRDPGDTPATTNASAYRDAPATANAPPHGDACAAANPDPYANPNAHGDPSASADSAANIDTAADTHPSGYTNSSTHTDAAGHGNPSTHSRGAGANR